MSNVTQDYSSGGRAPRPPSAHQTALLSFFGRHALTAREAHEEISTLLADPCNELRWREERARRCVSRIPGAVAGGGGHNQTLKVACVLVQGFDLPQPSARAILGEWNLSCQPPWSEHELDHKIRSADKMPGLQTPEGLKPRGCMVAPVGGVFVPSAQTRSAAGGMSETVAKQKVEYDYATLQRLAVPYSGVVDLVWLANRSAFDPALVTPAGFLSALYRPEEKVLCFTDDRSQGEALWPSEIPPVGGPRGVWFLAQPVTGKSIPNPRNEGKVSRRIAECCTAFRYMVIESDTAPLRDWLGFIVQVPLRIEALYTSGGRSVHALVRVDCATKEQWDAEKNAMMPFLMGSLMCGADRGTWSAVRLTRLPGCVRDEKRSVQKLLYLRPNAEVRPICELPVVRDVEAYWCGLAKLGVSDADETGGEAMKRALGYYSRVSTNCQQALAGLTSGDSK